MRFIKKNIIFLSIAFIIVAIVGISLSVAQLLDNDVEVSPDTDLIYYLDVTYDGVDRLGVESSDNTLAEIHSGYMYVEDKIPDGLSFEGFITTSDGTIGAVTRDSGTQCVGKVVDDTEEETVDTGTWNNNEYYYHGLHYNSDTRTVSFKVVNLKAGCKLTVGIKTKTPATVDDPDTPEVETRRDFYNSASLKDGKVNLFSNIVHAFMGREDLPMYAVTYSYTGDIPANAPQLPGEVSYIENTKVKVADPAELEGYTFSGWTTSDVEVTNNSFDMPANTISFVGSFTSIDANKVNYVIDGVTPPGYEKPLTKEYYPEDTVNVDSLKEGDVFNGYRFNGWETDVTVTDGVFTMPSGDVVVRGSFTEIEYTVTYAFYDTVLPPNANSLLPAVQSYLPGATVSEPTIEDPEGYHFLGWYKEDNFVMPDENVIIYGEWKVQTGTFEPTITQSIVDQKEKYDTGDVVTYKITVTNTAPFVINNVIIKENNELVRFAEGDGYSIESSHLAKILTIPANGSVDIFATYTIAENDVNKIVNEVELVGATANNNYTLNENTYKAVVEVSIQSHVIIHHYLEGTTTKVYEDEDKKYSYGEEYETSPKESNELLDEYKDEYEYKNKYDGDITGNISEKSIEVIYYYSKKSKSIIPDILPQTFDNILIFIGILAVSAIGLVAVIALLKKGIK